MNDGNGNGGGNGDYLPIGTFKQYRFDQASLCEAYRGTIETKMAGLEDRIDGSQKTIQWTIGISISVATILLMLMQWYIAARGV